MRNRGFSLIELLAALAVLALLMGAVLSVVGSLGRARPVAANTLSVLWRDAVVRGIDADVRQSAAIEVVEENILLLECWRRIDMDTGRMRHLPVRVAYRLVRVGEDEALVREQVSLSDANTAQATAAVMCVGISQASFALVEETADEPDAKPSMQEDGDGSDDQTVRSLHMHLQFTDPSMEPLDHVLLIRGQGS